MSSGNDTNTTGPSGSGPNNSQQPSNTGGPPSQPTPPPARQLPRPSRNPIPKAGPASYPPPPRNNWLRINADDVFTMLAQARNDWDRSYPLLTPGLGNDAAQRQVIADMYNEMGPHGSLIEAIQQLEYAFWNFGQAVQDWRRVRALENELAQGRTLHRDTNNTRLDRSNARGGDAFDVTKLTLKVTDKTGKKVTRSFDSPTFDHTNPRDILRLNRQRQRFLDDTIGPLICKPQGKAGEWWHPLEQRAVERRYAYSERTGKFPDWNTAAADHNRAFRNRRLPNSVEAPSERPGNKITQHVNRAALNKVKDKGDAEARHKAAQEALTRKYEVQAQALEKAWKDGFSATLADVDAVEQEDEDSDGSASGRDAPGEDDDDLQNRNVSRVAMNQGS
jgi:hypothetical protein